MASLIVSGRRALRIGVASLAALAIPGRGVYPAPEACAFFLVEAMDSIVNAVYDIMQAAEDCTVPSLSEKSCSSDLTDMMSYWFQMSADLCAATLTCGSLDNECGASVSQSLVELSDCAKNLVAASSDCIKDPFICTYDVVTAVDEMNGFIGNVVSALGDCNVGAKTPRVGALYWQFSRQFNRRLSDTASAEAPETQIDQRSVAPEATREDPARDVRSALARGAQRIHQLGDTRRSATVADLQRAWGNVQRVVAEWKAKRAARGQAPLPSPGLLV